MTDRISMKVYRLALCAAPLVLAWNVATVPARAQDASAPAPAQTQTQNEQTFSQAQIAQLVAPIALYPDALLTQILMASTYPLEVVEAARWSHDNSTIKGQALENAMQGQSWDPSVKALDRGAADARNDERQARLDGSSSAMPFWRSSRTCSMPCRSCAPKRRRQVT